MTALIRCCFSAETCLISPLRPLQLFFIAWAFFCQGSSDGCLLRFIYLILFTVLTCLLQRVRDLVSFQYVNMIHCHCSKLKSVTFHFFLTHAPSLSCFHSSKAYDPICILIFSSSFHLVSSLPQLEDFLST